MSVKKSIGWCDMTLNPIKGRCRGGCWYCYYSGKRGMLNRFKMDPKISLDMTVFDKLPKKSKRIFLCSTHDLFGDWIPGWYQDLILTKIEENFHHTFQILTKFPQNIHKKIPDNIWLGITVTANHEKYKLNKLLQHKARLFFASFEPLGGKIEISGYRCEFAALNWIIIGSMTGHGRAYQPNKKWIEGLVKEAKRYNIPIFLKDNLKEIWGEKLIQEFPDG